MRNCSKVYVLKEVLEDTTSQLELRFVTEVRVDVLVFQMYTPVFTVVHLY